MGDWQQLVTIQSSLSASKLSAFKMHVFSPLCLVEHAKPLNLHHLSPVVSKLSSHRIMRESKQRMHQLCMRVPR